MTPIPAILNTRVSTSKQDMDRQDFLLADYCQRNNLKPLATFSFPDTSGSIPMMKRDGAPEMFSELERLAQLGPVAYVVTNQDRVGRDMLDIVATIRTLWQMGVTPHFAGEGGPLIRTDENEFILGVKASAAQYARDRIRSNITMKFDAKRARNEVLNGCAPYGWNLKRTERTSKSGKPIFELEPNLEEQSWILKMAQLRVGGYGYRAIATWLNNNSVPTKRGVVQIQLRGQTMETCGRWKFGGVAKVLSNKTTRAWLASLAPVQAAA